MGIRTMESRRVFLAGTLGAAGLAITPGARALAQTRERPPQLKPELVKEFVGAAHGNLERTHELLDEQPSLLNATWDWGGGDWEAAIGGAGHMGRKDIATFLLGRGARMDIFVAAMLGRLDILKPTLEAFPELLHSRGPHGISLLRHARAGGAEAEAVVEFLGSKGITE
jgi:hypothetical protein